MTTQRKATATIHRELCRQRRAIGAASAEAFARAYLAHHFSLPRSPMHDDIFALLAEATEKRGMRIAVAAPRGHAKSTVVSLAYVLWSALYGHDAFTWIVSATREQAAQLLKHIKDELESNPLLASDFPECVGPIVAGKKPTPWRGSTLQIPTEAGRRPIKGAVATLVAPSTSSGGSCRNRPRGVEGRAANASRHSATTSTVSAMVTHRSHERRVLVMERLLSPLGTPRLA
jgi:hypothetical protein